MGKPFIDIEKLFREKNVKLTSQRRVILKLLAKNWERHLNAEEIHELLYQQHRGIGIATVYRTLDLFEKHGLVNRINLDDSYNRYQLVDAQGEHEHHHLICERCGQVMDMKDDLLESLEKQVYDKYGFAVRNHKVFLYGICKECRGK